MPRLFFKKIKEIRKINLCSVSKKYRKKNTKQTKGGMCEINVLFLRVSQFKRQILEYIYKHLYIFVDMFTVLVLK